MAAVRFGEVKVETNAEQHMFEVEVYLNDLDPEAVRVELYADGIDGASPVRQEMERVCTWRGQRDSRQDLPNTVPAARPASDYTTRVIPKAVRSCCSLWRLAHGSCEHRAFLGMDNR